jgi:hypothetical protein
MGFSYKPMLSHSHKASMQFQRPRAVTPLQTHRHFHHLVQAPSIPTRQFVRTSQIRTSLSRSSIHLPNAHVHPSPSSSHHVNNQPPQQNNSPRSQPARATKAATKTVTFPTARPLTPRATRTAEATAPRAAIPLGNGVEAPTPAAGASQAGYYVALGVGVCGLVCGCCCYAAGGYGEGGDGGDECVVEEEMVVRTMKWESGF